jgi:hypothetical protein
MKAFEQTQGARQTRVRADKIECGESDELERLRAARHLQFLRSDNSAGCSIRLGGCLPTHAG